MQPKMAKYDSTVVLRKSPYNYISKLENKHMAYMSIDSNAKNIANAGSFVSEGNIHHLSSHLHQIPHQQQQTLLRHYIELIYIKSDILIALRSAECAIRRSAI